MTEGAIDVRKLIVLVVLLCVSSCSKHENFPNALDVNVPPKVTNIAVTVTVDPTEILYDLTWDIGDPSVVDHYKVYALVPYSPAELLGTSPTADFQAVAAFEIPGLSFGVSVVTTQFVEGGIVSAPAR